MLLNCNQINVNEQLLSILLVTRELVSGGWETGRQRKIMLSLDNVKRQNRLIFKLTEDVGRQTGDSFEIYVVYCKSTLCVS